MKNRADYLCADPRLFVEAPGGLSFSELVELFREKLSFLKVENFKIASFSIVSWDSAFSSRKEPPVRSGLETKELALKL